MSESLSRKLGKFAYSLNFEDLPKKAIDKAKACVLEALSAAVTGRNLPWSQIAAKVASGSRGSSTVIGSGRRVAAADAAFANAVMAHSVIYEDHWHTPGGGHPGVVIVPTVLSLAEDRLASGRDAICAIVTGYELYGRIYLGLGGLRNGFRPTPVVGAIGAAAAAGRLLGLNEDKMVTALGYATNFASGLNECWLTGTMEAMFHAGVAARNGIMAATLAAAGASAAETSLEGKYGFCNSFSKYAWDPSLITANLGKNFIIVDVLQKLYPVCANNQIAIDIALSLKKQHRIESSQIRKVIEITSQAIKAGAGQDCAGPFLTHFQAVLSIQFCAAAALLDKPVDDPIFYFEHYGDPDIAELAKKVEVVGQEDRAFPRIEVFMQDGKKYTIEEDRRDKLLLSLSTAQEKFRRLATKALGSATTEKVLNLVANMDELQNIQELTQKFAKLKA